MFLGGEQGLGAATNEFLDAMVDLASQPQDLGRAPGGAGACGGHWPGAYHAPRRDLDEMQAGRDAGAVGAVARVNEISTHIADVNGRLPAAGHRAHAQ